jgi:hypothetical protein
MSYLGAPLQTEGGSQGAITQRSDEIWMPHQMEGTSTGTGVADQSVVFLQITDTGFDRFSWTDHMVLLLIDSYETRNVQCRKRIDGSKQTHTQTRNVQAESRLQENRHNTMEENEI